jgi:small GTP-binding protein
MIPEIEAAVREVLNQYNRENREPRLLILGATGTGKSSLINAIFGTRIMDVKTMESTTRVFRTVLYELGEGSHVQITDSPGYGEIGHHEQYCKDVKEVAKKNDLIIMVLKADEKGYSRDYQIYKDVSYKLGEHSKPFIIVLNQIDKVKPSREWDPPYDIDSPPSPDDSEKLRNIREKVSLVKSQFALKETPVVATMADPDEGRTMGIDKLKVAILQALPEISKYKFAVASKIAENASAEVMEELDSLATKVIATASFSAAGAVALNPIPASDAVALLPIQVTMVLKLGSIYGKKLDKEGAIETVLTLAAGTAARTAFQFGISLIPGVKNLIGPPYAAAATYGIGVAARSYFKSGSMPDALEIRKIVEQGFDKYKDIKT